MLYHLDRAKESLRKNDFAILVEGYMDAIAVARAGFANVVASCGTSLAEPQIKLLSAGHAASGRELRSGYRGTSGHGALDWLAARKGV